MLQLAVLVQDNSHVLGYDCSMLISAGSGCLQPCGLLHRLLMHHGTPLAAASQAASKAAASAEK